MRYLLKGGVLSIPESETVLARIQNEFPGARKLISLSDEGSGYRTDIHTTDCSETKRGDVRSHTYTLQNGAGKILMEAHPDYASDDHPDAAEWPICRMSCVDHANLLIESTEYFLVMHNSQHYSLQNEAGAVVLQVMHKGISGGWIIETSETFSAQVLCGLFLFCRYIEQENEFTAV